MEETLYSLADLVKISRGNQDFVNRMKRIFVEETQRGLRNIDEALKANDLERVAKVAHRMKPSLGNMKISKLDQPIRRLEDAHEHYDGMQADLDLLRGTLNQVIADLKEEEVN
jgi:HPt (histidine-containing phosphotransfer) domain-containing protein